MGFKSLQHPYSISKQPYDLGHRNIVIDSSNILGALMALRTFQIDPFTSVLPLVAQGHWGIQARRSIVWLVSLDQLERIEKLMELGTLSPRFSNFKLPFVLGCSSIRLNFCYILDEQKGQRISQTVPCTFTQQLFVQDHLGSLDHQSTLWLVNLDQLVLGKLKAHQNVRIAPYSFVQLFASLDHLDKLDPEPMVYHYG